MSCCSNSGRDSRPSSEVERSAGPPSTGPASYEFDKHRSLPGERGVDVLPDPRRPAAGKANGYPASTGDSDTGGDAVPVPLRVTKKPRRSTQPSRGDVSASDVSAGSGELAGPGMTSSLRHSGPGEPPAYSNLSFERDTPQEQRRDGRGGPGSRDKAAGKKKRQKSTDTAGGGAADPIRDPVMRNIAAQQQQLRVHIKAQPGTAVHITPSATPPTQQAPAYHAGPPTTTAASQRPAAGRTGTGRQRQQRAGPHRAVPSGNAGDNESETEI